MSETTANGWVLFKNAFQTFSAR